MTAQAHHTRADSSSVQTFGGQVEPGDALRARIHFLVAQHHALVGQTQFADAKAAALMTLIGIIALRGPLPADKLGGDVFGVALGAMMAFSILCCLWAIMPRYPWTWRFGRKTEEPNGSDFDRFSWTALGSPGWAAERYADFAREGDFAALIGALAASNVGASRVLRKKFRAMRCAALSAMAAVVLVVAQIALAPTL